MAEDSAQERTEQATPKRREDARRKGQVPRSRDLNSAAVTLAVGSALYLLGSQIAGRLSGMMQRGFSLSREQATDLSYLLPALGNAAGEGLRACAAVLAVAMLAALLAPMVLGGWNFSSQALAPQFKRLNPLEGIKRMFSIRALVELGKALAKFGVVALVAALVLWNEAPTLLALGREPLTQAIGHALTLAGQALLAITGGLLIIAGFDVPYQLWQHAKQLRMSRQEVREEHKESEGSPEVKSRIRQLQQQIASQRMMQEIPTADVVVTNPTHFAVALRYDEKRMRAPVVVAKGADLIAARIRELAAEHGVPLFEAPPLARALHRSVDIGAEVPSSLYVAVAQVLSYVFQLRVARRAGMPPPPRPVVEVEE